MVGLFGAKMVVHFNPKDLGLSAGIYGTVFGQSGLNIRNVFGRSGARLLCFFFGSSETNCRIMDWPMCAIFGVIAKDE